MGGASWGRSTMRRLSWLLALAALAGCKPEDPPAANGGPAAGGSAQENRIAQARKLLAEAGYADGKGFPTIEFLYSTSETNKKIAAALQSMWKTGLGVEVALVNTEWKTYLDRLSKMDYQFGLRGWIGDYNDPNTFLDMFMTGSGNNNTGFSNDEYDELIRKANAEPDKDERRAMLERVEEILMTELPISPINFYVSQQMRKPYVKGWHSNLQSIHPLKSAYREDGQTLVINNNAEIQTLDPGIARGVPEHRVQIGLYEGLLNYHPETSEPIPGAAERWEVSPDQRTYTFHLRECRWSDGKPVTARDFEYAWRRVLDPATPTDYAYQLFYIKGGRAFREGTSIDPRSIGLACRDDRTLVVELENPCAFFLNLMPFFTYYPVRKDIVERHGTRWTLPENLVCNGAFRVVERVTNQHLILEKNPEYWDAANVRQQRIKFLPIDTVSTAFSKYDAGECDIITSVPLEFIRKLQTQPDFYAHNYLGTSYFSFNVTRPPFRDAKVRRAFALAVDRETLCENILKGGQKPAYNYVPTSFPGFRHTRLDSR